MTTITTMMKMMMTATTTATAATTTNSSRSSDYSVGSFGPFQSYIISSFAFCWCVESSLFHILKFLLMWILLFISFASAVLLWSVQECFAVHLVNIFLAAAILYCLLLSCSCIHLV
jgi:hypothetical protein